MTWCDSGIFWDLPLDWPARLGSEMGRAGPVGHTFQGVSVGRSLSFLSVLGRE